MILQLQWRQTRWCAFFPSDSLPSRSLNWRNVEDSDLDCPKMSSFVREMPPVAAVAPLLSSPSAIGMMLTQQNYKVLTWQISLNWGIPPSMRMYVRVRVILYVVGVQLCRELKHSRWRYWESSKMNGKEKSPGLASRVIKAIKARQHWEKVSAHRF